VALGRQASDAPRAVSRGGAACHRGSEARWPERSSCRSVFPAPHAAGGFYLAARTAWNTPQRGRALARQLEDERLLASH
jgi:hypothetical protein